MSKVVFKKLKFLTNNTHIYIYIYRVCDISAPKIVSFSGEFWFLKLLLSVRTMKKIKFMFDGMLKVKSDVHSRNLRFSLSATNWRFPRNFSVIDWRISWPFFLRPVDTKNDFLFCDQCTYFAIYCELFHFAKLTWSLYLTEICKDLVIDMKNRKSLN